MLHTSPGREEEHPMQQQGQPRWRPTRRQFLSGVGIVAALAVLGSIFGGYVFGWAWTGLVKDANFHKRTLWDWMQLLIIPAVLAGVGLWFNRQQRKQEIQTADRRAQDEALQAYLDQMSAMLIPNKDLPSLYKARPGDSLSEVGRARTLTVLARLDGERKARVVQFLHEAGLVAKTRPVLHLREADLRGADLRGADLNKVNLSEVNLSNADLREAILNEGILSEAKLIAADLRFAELRGANLYHARLGRPHVRSLDMSLFIDTTMKGADLSNADLRGAILDWADLEGAVLSEANLRGAHLRRVHTITGANLSKAMLSEADLRGAHLVGANLRGAILRKADLRSTYLSEADLRGAYLGEADLREATGWTEEQLRTAQSLEGVMMPDGQTLKSDYDPDGPTFEEWLKSQGRKENGENSRPP
jgi:uncharacterized protein YjbI with pentapeptide repeats